MPSYPKSLFQRISMSVSAELRIVATPRVSLSSNLTTKNNFINTQIPVKIPSLRTPNPHQNKPIKHVTKRTNNSSSDIIRLMDSLSQTLTPEIYTSLIKECTLNADPVEALHLHSHLTNQVNIKLTSPLVHRLLLMHLSCGQFDIALKLFDEMPPRNNDFISWAIMIIGCFNNLKYEMGIGFFIDMFGRCGVYGGKGVFFNSCNIWVVVIICVIKACVHTENMEFGKQIHGFLVKLGVSNEEFVDLSLMEFYGKFGCLEGVNSVFNKVANRNTVTWTSKIVHNSRNESFYEVIEGFEEMGKAGIKMNCHTFSSVLRACARINDGNCGKQVHALAIKRKLELHGFVQCGLIDMYGKCGMISDAEKVFQMVNDKADTAFWNALLMAYVRSGLFIEAIKLLYQIDAAKIQVNESLINDIRIWCVSAL